MPGEASTESAITRILRVIQAELAIYPGRVSLIVRIVLACTLSMALVMIFRIPGAALGAYYPLLLSRDSPRSTRRSAVRTGVICTITTVEVIFGAMLFAGSPFLHFFWVTANLFAAFYLISSLTIYDAALAAGLLITNAIATWDLPVPDDVRLTQTLYTLLSILTGCAVSVAVEYLLARTHPTDTVRDGIQQRLSLVGRLLEGYARGEASVFPVRSLLSKMALKGTGHLRQQLTHSSYESRYKERLSAALALSGRLVELAATLSELPAPNSPEEQARCALIGASIDSINLWLTREETPEWIVLPDFGDLKPSLLVEIERTVDLISQSLSDEDGPVHHHLPEPGEEERLPSFVADAFSSPRHLRFAIRGTLSALACYLVYMSVGWTGLGASIATCILTALTTTGASRHKQLMRFAGVILGACVLGFGIQAIILPQIDSILSFSLLFAAVIAFGAWIGTSGPRIAYVGAQVVLAYDLVNLNRFTIATSLQPARDVVLGIVLGIAAMWLIFDHLWASPASNLTRRYFLSSFRDIANLKLSLDTDSPVTQSRHLMAECSRINARLDRVRSLVDVSVFEAHPKPKDEVYVTHCVKVLQPELRAYLLVDSGLLQHALVDTAEPISPLVAEVRESCHAILLEALQIIEQRHPHRSITSAGLRPVTSALEAAMQNAKDAGRQSEFVSMRLCVSLLELARNLHSSAISTAAAYNSTAASEAELIPGTAVLSQQLDQS